MTVVFDLQLRAQENVFIHGVITRVTDWPHDNTIADSKNVCH